MTERRRLFNGETRIAKILRAADRLSAQADGVPHDPSDPLTHISARAFVDVISGVNDASTYADALQRLADPAEATGLSWYEALFRPMYGEAVAQIAGTTRAAYPEGVPHAVDFGARTGFAAQATAELASRVTIIDPYPRLLDLAESHLSHDGTVEVQRVDGGVEALEHIPDESADIVTALAPLRHMTREEVAHFFEQSSRILHPGGTLIYYLHLRPADHSLPDHDKGRLAGLIDSSLSLFEPGDRLSQSHFLGAVLNNVAFRQTPHRLNGGILVTAQRR